jgi:hypothetical protein
VTSMSFSGETISAAATGHIIRINGPIPNITFQILKNSVGLFVFANCIISYSVYLMIINFLHLISFFRFVVINISPSSVTQIRFLAPFVFAVGTANFLTLKKFWRFDVDLLFGFWNHVDNFVF